MNRALTAVLILFATTPAHGWTAASDRQIASKALEVAPQDLRMLVEKFHDDFAAGLAQAESDEGSDVHHYFVLSRSGRLRERIERETGTTIAMIRAGKPMPEVVKRLGSLAHFVADANDPFHVGSGDGRLDPAQDDYEQYFERRMARFATVFYGLDPHFRLAPYLDRTFQRTASFYPLLDEEYFRSGTRTTSATFDDRSTAFGVAAVCYSRAVTDLANLYYHVWKEAGGDVRSAARLKGSRILNGGIFRDEN